MRRGWGAGEQTDRKREACRPPERKLTSGSSGVSQPQPEPAARSQTGLVLQPSLSLALGVVGKHGAGVPAVGKKRPGRTVECSWPIKTPDLLREQSILESQSFILRALCPSVLQNEPVL